MMEFEGIRTSPSVLGVFLARRRNSSSRWTTDSSYFGSGGASFTGASAGPRTTRRWKRVVETASPRRKAVSDEELREQIERWGGVHPETGLVVSTVYKVA